MDRTQNHLIRISGIPFRSERIHGVRRWPGPSEFSKKQTVRARWSNPETIDPCRSSNQKRTVVVRHAELPTELLVNCIIIRGIRRHPMGWPLLEIRRSGCEASRKNSELKLKTRSHFHTGRIQIRFPRSTEPGNKLSIRKVTGMEHGHRENANHPMGKLDSRRFHGVCVRRSPILSPPLKIPMRVPARKCGSGDQYYFRSE